MKRSSFLKGLLGVAALPLIPKIIEVDETTIPEEKRCKTIGCSGWVDDDFYYGDMPTTEEINRLLKKESNLI